MIRVLVADGHGPRRAGLRAVVEAERGMGVIATAASGLEAVALAVARRADVVLLDPGLPAPMSGLEATAAITARAGSPRVVVLPAMVDGVGDGRAVDAGVGVEVGDAVAAALAAGAHSSLTHRCGPAYLVATIRAAARREPAPPQGNPDDGAGLVTGLDATGVDFATPVHLSEREREVLAAVASGASNKDAAAMLFISESTVKSHLSHAYGKLGVDSRVDAVAQARQRGLLGA